VAVPLSPLELRARLDAGEELVLLDVREHEELALARLDGCVHIPMGELGVRAAELDPERPVVCICHHGIRSANVAAYLESLDFEQVFNLTGGVDRWSLEVDPALPRY